MSQKTITNSPPAASLETQAATQAKAGLKRIEGASSRNGLTALHETPHGESTKARRTGNYNDARFQAFVERVGGSGDTDKRTLEILFEIWEEQGRP